jgi:hypothetical protein
MTQTSTQMKPDHDKIDVCSGFICAGIRGICGPLLSKRHRLTLPASTTVIAV